MATARFDPAAPQAPPDRDPDRLPDSTDPSGPCPRCGRVSNFGVAGSTPVTFGNTAIQHPDGRTERNHIEQATVLECAGCHQRLVVVEEQLVGGISPRLSSRLSGSITWRGIHWWPSPGAGTLDPDVSGNVASAFDEGMRALSASCPRAAVVMFRGMLAEVVADKGSSAAQQAKTLYDQLKAMEREGTLHPSLVQWAAEIRVVGNAGAHPSTLDSVDPAEAQDLSQLCRRLLDVVYETPARIRRARTARRPPGP
jgi:hypothetical protein